MKRCLAMKRYMAGIVLGLFALSAALYVVPSQAQTDTVSKVAAYDTATNGAADALLAAPGGGSHLVIYGVDATCETAATFTLTLTEDAAGTPAVIGKFGGPSASNIHVEFPEGLVITDNDTLTATASACGAGVDGHVTVWGAIER